MKVTFFYRPKLLFGFSIERVFEEIKFQLRDKIEILDFYCTHRWKRLYSLLNAYKFQGDVNHITGDAHFLALALKGSKTVLTIHDVGHYERSLKGVKKWLFKYFWFKYPMQHVHTITTISEFTKSKLVSYNFVAPEKIRVVHNPAPIDFPFSAKVFDQQNPKILQVGSGLNKNLNRLIEAIKGQNFSLILVRRKDSDIEQILINEGISYEWYERISREDLYECYCNSDIVFFASEYEGFGVPILEANSVGRIVITSNLASMPEVAGDSAVLVDPFDVSSIRNGLNEIKNNESLRNQLISNGVNNLKRFSPKYISSVYYDIYKEILNNN